MGVRISLQPFARFERGLLSSARHRGFGPMPDSNLKVGKANAGGIKGNAFITELGKEFEDNALMWFYILAETQDQ